MTKESRFSVKARLKSFAYAFSGLKILLREEHNSRIHLIAAILAIIAGFLFEINKSEWVEIIFAIGFVFVTEIINSSIENLADIINPEKNDRIKKIKDLSAAAVLVASIVAAFIGFIIFLPKIIALL
jgi:diacylglycerol kinase